MKSKLVVPMIAAATALVASFTATAADNETVLTNVMSPVMVNQGESYVQAQEGMALFPGDQLMVMAGGSAQVHYATGCVEELGGNEILRISADETCSTASTAGTYGDDGTGTGTGGGGGGGGGGGNTVGLLLTAGVAGGVIVKVTEDDENGSN